MTDPNEITRALKLWFQPGDVFEVRVLDSITADWRRPHTESGYFDYDHIEEAAKAVKGLHSYRGAYATVNPVNPDLLARACNRIRGVTKEPTSSDADIISRRWLLIDCDAKRPSGVSSSDAEHQAALAKAKEIRAGLATLNWPQPILTDSGNGAQLMYRIDLPTDDGELVSKVIGEIAKSSSEQVAVDITVHNPARIWRIPGTMNCKGDNVPTRPHRMCKIIDEPAELTLVTQEQLQDIVSSSPNKTAEIKPANAFDLDDWIAKYCPDLGSPVEWKGGRKWVFPICPFNEAHTNKSAVLIQEPSGAIAFKCHHNGCTGNDWHKLRELKEPGCYDKKEEDAGVNLEGILGKKPVVVLAIPVEPEIARPWRDIQTSDIREMLKGTYLGELVNIYSCVTRPPLPLEASLLKAIATVACCLTGEATNEELRRRAGSLGSLCLIGADRARLKINTAGGQVCNVYAMLVANSTSGKDIGNLIGKFTRMNNPYIKLNDGETISPDWNLGTSCSAEGLAKVLTRKPNGLLVISEMRNWLDPTHWQHKATEFLTESFGRGYFEQNFSDRSQGGGTRSNNYCCPNIIANIQPKTFNNIVDMQDIDTGFIGRFIFAAMPEFYGNPARFDSIELMGKMRSIVDIFLRKSGVVELDEKYADDIQEVFKGKCDPKINSAWRRLCCEYYPRFMVMLSVNHDRKTHGETVIITDEVKSMAKTLTLWFFAQAEKVLSGIMDCDLRSRDLEKKLVRIFEIIRDQDRGDGVLTSTISRCASGSGTTSSDRSKLLAELMERGWISLENSRYKVSNPPPGMVKPKVRKKGK